MKDKSLFYPVGTPVEQVLLLASAVTGPGPAPVDMLEFTEEEGGNIERELAVPFVPGMDAIVLTEASLRLRGAFTRISSTVFETSTSTRAADVGVAISLPLPAHVVSIRLDGVTFPQSIREGADRLSYEGLKTGREGGTPKEMHLVVRAGTPDASGVSYGPPMFVHQPLQVSEMYPSLLGNVTGSVSGTTLTVRLPGVFGSHWLVQFATGDGPTNLAPVPFDATVGAVHVNAAPRNLTVSLLIPNGDPVLLWRNPDLLLPDAGDQLVSFTPVAQRHLTERLSAVDPAAAALPLTIRFQSDSAGKVEVCERTLAGRYEVLPFGPKPQSLSLRGAAASVDLTTPVGRKPSSSQGTVRVRHQGMITTPGSSSPPPNPSHGLVIADGRHIARGVVAGAGPGPYRVLEARALLETDVQSEIVLEVHSDVAGALGPRLLAPIVRRLEPGRPQWISFPFKELALVPGSTLWLAMRSNLGRVLWYCHGRGAVRVSDDKGETWGEAQHLLGHPEAPLTLLFHAVDPPYAEPVMGMAHGSMPEGLVQLRRVPDDDKAFTAPFALPTPILDALRVASGTPRALTRVDLSSDAVLEVTFEDATLSYDPFS